MRYVIKYQDNHHNIPLYISSIEMHLPYNTTFHGKANIARAIKYVNLHKARIHLMSIKKSREKYYYYSSRRFKTTPKIINL